MNANMGLLQVNAQAPATTSSMMTNKKSQGQQNNSFSDKLHTAVMQSGTGESTDNKSDKLLLPNVPTSLVIKTCDPADSQPLIEDLLSGEDIVLNDNTAAEASAMLLTAMQVASSALVSSTAAGQIPLTTDNGVATVLATNQQPLIPLPELLTPVVMQSGKVTEGNSITADNTVAADNNPMSSVQMSEEPIPANTQANMMSTVTTRSTQQEHAISLPAQSNDTMESLTNQTIIASQSGISIHSQQQKAETSRANELIGKSELPQLETEVIPLVSLDQKGKNPSKGFAGDGQKHFADESLSNQYKLMQDIPINTVEVTNTHTFAQGLDAALNKINPTASTETQQPGLPFTDVHQVVDQIVEHTRLIAKPQTTEMIIKLKPEHLGELTLKVAVENGVVNASFHSNNSEVRHIIEQSLPQLKLELANQGLKVDNVSISAGLDQFLPNHDQERNSRQQFIKFTNKKAVDEFVEAIDGELAESRISGLGSQDGVDYRI